MTDIIDFRVILDNIDECYKATGVFHSNWNCIPGRFKDYISSPKINNYQSLHTAVIGPNKRPIEIQLRTMQMHEYAQRGIASHWKYKSSEKFNSLTWKEYDWLADLVKLLIKTKIQRIHMNLQNFKCSKMFFFYSKGSVIKLPKNITFN